MSQSSISDPNSPQNPSLTACRKSCSRREEALTFSFLPKKFEPRYLGCYTAARPAPGVLKKIDLKMSVWQNSRDNSM
ncbi:MAG: hypothetical protein DME22_20960 [Verrucomicrobia bacterium]|nr:MAG: hypothetical protein DME22_20960 [Verrucomicrobiota bacterium]PYJ93600.1 MAG: hypothetical protein DME23_25950 [Verrucomicrobiota bacterium]